MLIGVPTEIKPNERRVGLTPDSVHALADAGHEVLVQAGAGEGTGFPDAEYVAAGGTLAERDEVWDRPELVVKVKEPIESEFRHFREDLTLFAYLHLAAARPLTEALLGAGMRAIAYETVREGRALPLLAPMSEIAGRLAAQAAARYSSVLEGGPGILLGGAPGVAPARVVVLGGGVVGTQAAQLALGLRAEVTVLDASLHRVRELDQLFGTSTRVLASNPRTIERELEGADVVIGSVLVPGARAPKLVRREHLARMKPGALLIDVAIDQGGCFETSHPTSYDDPVFELDGVRHFCVTNMPGAVPRTATASLNNATLPYVLRLAEGVDAALAGSEGLAAGVNTAGGRITAPGVAAAYEELPSAVG